MRVRDVMTSPVITLRARTPLQAAAALLVAQGFTGTPVVDGDGRVVGIMTEANLMRGQLPPDKSGPGTTVGPTGRCCHNVGSAGDATRGRLGRRGRDHAQREHPARRRRGRARGHPQPSRCAALRGSSRADSGQRRCPSGGQGGAPTASSTPTILTATTAEDAVPASATTV